MQGQSISPYQDKWQVPRAAHRFATDSGAARSNLDDIVLQYAAWEHAAPVGLMDQ